MREFAGRVGANGVCHIIRTPNAGVGGAKQPIPYDAANNSACTGQSVVLVAGEDVGGGLGVASRKQSHSNRELQCPPLPPSLIRG